MYPPHSPSTCVQCRPGVGRRHKYLFQARANMVPKALVLQWYVFSLLSPSCGRNLGLDQRSQIFLTLRIDTECTGDPSKEQVLGKTGLQTRCATMLPERVGLGIQKDHDVNAAELSGQGGCIKLFKNEGCWMEEDMKEIAMIEFPYNRQCILF